MADADWSDESSDGTVAFDPHVHTEGSYDAAVPVERVLERAQAVGLDALCVTDHDTIDESLRAVDLAPSFGLVAIPGVELSTADGHLLALGVDQCPEPGRPVAESVRTVRDMGGLAIVPHPFQRSRHGIRRRDIVGCDGIEVRNAWSMTGLRNRSARRFARARSYPKIGGSDAHSTATVGLTYTELALDPDRADRTTVLAAVRDGDTRARGVPAPRRRYLRKFAASAGRKTGSAVAGLGRRFLRVDHPDGRSS